MEFGNQSKSYLSELLRLGKNGFKAFAYQKLTVAGTAVGLTVPTEAKYAEIRLESTITSTPAIRYNLIGGTNLPTSTDGLAILNLELFDITDYQNLISFRTIQVGAGTHTLHIQYFK